MNTMVVNIEVRDFGVITFASHMPLPAVTSATATVGLRTILQDHLLNLVCTPMPSIILMKKNSS